MGEGILPIGQSSFPMSDFALVGSGEAYGNCGEFFTVGCLNVSEHEGCTLDGVNFSGKAYLKRVQNSCDRPLCPVCWKAWANREAKRAERRLDAFVLKNHGGKRLKPIHVMVSVPKEDYGLSLPEMRKKVYRALKKVHCLGGMMISHPRRKNKDGEWYFSPHFHIIGYGWISGIDVHRNYVHSGYIVKNIGVRKTVAGTIWYQLSHAGISEKHHTVTWFGLLSYNKLKVPKIEKDVQECPLCGEKLRRVVYIGDGEPEFPDVEGGCYFDVPKNWMYRPRKIFYGED